MDPSKEKLPRGEMVKMVLLGLGLVGVVGAVCICPNLLQLVPRSYRSRRRYPQIRQAILRLDKKGWIIARETSQGWKIHLTKKGYAEWMAYEIGEKRLKKPRRWDKKWRILIFDIPEKRRHIREKIRHVLRSFEFERLQDSVWVYPYECRDVLELLRTKYGVRFDALSVLAESIDNDRWLRKQFRLK